MDPASHLCTVVLLATAHPAVAAVAAFAGLLNDERMGFALPFVVLWHASASFGPGWPKAGARFLGGMLIGIALYAGLRHALTVGWIGPGIEQPQVYSGFGATLRAFQPYESTWLSWSSKVVAAFRWSWLFPLGFAVWLVKRGQGGFAALFCGVIAAEVASTTLVFDVARSIGFAFPALLLAIRRLHQSAPERTRRQLLWVTAVTVVTPVFYLSDSGRPVVFWPF